MATKETKDIYKFLADTRTELLDIVDTTNDGSTKHPSPYLRFIPLLAYTEFLGLCIDEKHDVDDPSRPTQRINLAIKDLFVNREYYRLHCGGKINFPNLRHAMMHRLQMTSDVRLTTRYDAKNQNLYHLKIHAGKYVIVLEDFAQDIIDTIDSVISKHEEGDKILSRLSLNWISVEKA